MKRLKGERLILKDISEADQDTMGLRWAWEAGKTVTYVASYGHDYCHGERKSRSLIALRNADTGRNTELWVFDMFIQRACVWNV